MNVALAYHNGDRERAIEWLEHCKRWNALKNHTLYLMPAYNCQPIPEIVPFIGLTDYLQVLSNWRSADGVTHANASGPNSMLVQFARHFYDNKLGSWFFCESDCVALKPDAFDRLEAEYLACGKPYMGGYAPAPVPHVNGNMILPQNAALLSTLMLPMRSSDGTRDIAFDVAAAREILPQAHQTALIQHLWRGPSFTSQADFDSRIRPEAVFYHQCRDGSIYKYLSGGTKTEEPPAYINAGYEPETPGCKCGAKAGGFHEVWCPARTGFFSEPKEHPNGVSPFAALSGHNSNGSTSSNSLEVQRARAAKARAALAAKRASGWKPGPRKKRKRAKKA